MSDPKARLSAALDKVDNACGQPDCLSHIDEALAHEDGYQRIARNLLAALPDDTAIFTVDSLAAAIETLAHGKCCWEPQDDATDIIKAAKEAERE